MKKVGIIFLIIFCLWAQVARAQTHLYGNFEIVLKNCVTDEGIDKEKLRDNEHALLAFIGMAGHVPIKEVYAWERNERLAFWINVYNACSLAFMLNVPYTDSLLEMETGPDKKNVCYLR